MTRSEPRYLTQLKRSSAIPVKRFYGCPIIKSKRQSLHEGYKTATKKRYIISEQHEPHLRRQESAPKANPRLCHSQCELFPQARIAPILLNAILLTLRRSTAA